MGKRTEVVLSLYLLRGGIALPTSGLRCVTVVAGTSVWLINAAPEQWP